MRKDFTRVREPVGARPATRAIRRDAQHLELLDAVDLSTGRIVLVTGELDEETPLVLPSHHMGVIRSPITRDFIYGDER